MGIGVGRDAREMGDAQDLPLSGDRRYRASDAVRGFATDSGVDLIEHHDPRATFRLPRCRKCPTQREQHPRKFSARSDLTEGPWLASGIGSEQERNSIDPRGTEARTIDHGLAVFWRTPRYLHADTGAIHTELAELPHDRFREAFCCLMARFRETSREDRRLGERRLPLGGEFRKARFRSCECLELGRKTLSCREHAGKRWTVRAREFLQPKKSRLNLLESRRIDLESLAVLGEFAAHFGEHIPTLLDLRRRTSETLVDGCPRCELTRETPKCVTRSAVFSIEKCRHPGRRAPQLFAVF